MGQQLQPEHLQDQESSLGYHLILFNDDVNTFDYVITCLIDICKHEPMQAEQCAMVAHYNGKCPVMSGSYEILQPYAVRLQARGLSVEVQS
ncbi:MAG: ATP-dependent Clp protease adaptor ClpS [Lentimicrobiaceae bacterium]|nr:ATP-dependent Clp protease adaptor ClpS [Lentimicrobiaceae bacterium]